MGYQARAAIDSDLDAIVRLTWAVDASFGLPPQSDPRVPAIDLASLGDRPWPGHADHREG